MKRLGSLLICLCLLLQAFGPVSVWAEGENYCGDSAYWTLEGKVLYITGTGDMYDYASFTETVPWDAYVDNIVRVVIDEGITNIGGGAFADFVNLTEVKISSTVTTIDVNAFAGCEALSSFTVPTNVSKINFAAFVNCIGLREILVEQGNTHYVSVDGVLFTSDLKTLVAYPVGSDNTHYTVPDQTEHIERYAFSQGTKLKEVMLNDGLLTIGDEAFLGCTDITSIKVPHGVTFMGGGVFQDCEKLSSVSLPTTLRECGEYVFLDTALYHNKTNWDNNVLYIDSVLISATYLDNESFDETVLTGTQYQIKDGTTLIASGALQYLEIPLFYFPDTLKYISSFAFFASGIQSVTLPDSVVSIGERAFWMCHELTDVTLGNNITHMEQNVFEETQYIDNESHVENDVFYNGPYALKMVNSSATSVTIREGTTLIAGMAMEDGSRVTEMTLPESLRYMSIGALCNTGNLKKVAIPFGVHTIEDYAIGYYYNSYTGDYSRQYGVTLEVYRDSTAESYALANGFDIEYRKPAATDMTIGGTLTGYIGEVLWLSADFAPEDCATEAVTWESSNPEIASVQVTADGCAVVLNTVGSVTVTATSEKGLTASVTVTSMDYLHLVLDTPIEDTFESLGDDHYYYFTSATDGIYTFTVITAGCIVHRLTTLDESDSISSSTGYVRQFKANLTGGQTYKLRLRCVDDMPSGDYSVSVVTESRPTALVLAKAPEKTQYLMGEELNLTGMVLEMHYNTGNRDAMMGLRPSGFDSSTPGTKTLTFDLLGMSTSFDVEVLPFDGERKMTRLHITHQPNKQSYAPGESFDPTGMEVTAYYNDGTTEVVTDYTHSSLSIMEGFQTVTVYYGDMEATVEVLVEQQPLLELVSIAIQREPFKTVYMENEDFDSSGLWVNAQYSNGTSQKITDYTLSGYSASPGTKTITVIYQGMTATFTVEVKAAHTHSPVAEGNYAATCKQPGWEGRTVCRECMEVLTVGRQIPVIVHTTMGWVLDGGRWKYTWNDGCVTAECVGWKEDSTGWCYVGEDGFMVTERWVEDSAGWCYVGADGYCVINCWMQDSIGWCYLDGEGRMATNRWILDSVGWCYVGADGYCVTNCWMQDSIGWCYLDGEGRMATNRWIMDSVGWCYVGADGYCITNAWMADSVGWCYLDGDGRMVVNDYVRDSSGLCYLDANGYWDGIYR